ncbi:MAG: M20 family metallo-hydrolase [Bacteroidetes bacterium]|nr:M20 family metallo-hydrolase [Bacteroidota bacterium]MDA1120041.1 M20 family metallo-hydrolase [Bacteroidota bacterium]
MDLYSDILGLLKQLISTPSMSKEEDKTAAIIAAFLSKKDIPWERSGNNIWATNLHFDSSKPTVLLNSHHDTVKPNPNYTLDPFEPIEKDGKLYGLGSNDAGGCLVSLIGTFVNFYRRDDLAFNLIVAPTAEEEISGRGGLEALLPKLGELDCAIVGEPTGMNMAISEKGLMVIDGETIGIAGHAARDTGVNALYLAMDDISKIRDFKFEKVSEWLGRVKMTVTVINSGTQHNVVPGTCQFVIDVRTNDSYTNEEVFEIIKSELNANLKARSFRMKPSFIEPSHPLVKAGEMIGCELFGSPTSSDQTLLSIPSVKIGPGMSERSHTPDEFIYLDELKGGLTGYIQLLEHYNKILMTSSNH